LFFEKKTGGKGPWIRGPGPQFRRMGLQNIDSILAFGFDLDG
jgi:hypothetical protein